MKYKINLAIFLTLFGFGTSCSQVSELITNDFTSPNEDFWITVKGLAYEGYSGKQEITLKNRDDHVLWKKNESIWSPPIVSNLGIVALLYTEVRFFDTTGDEIGSYEINDSLETFWTECADCSPIQLFSPDGNNYYTIVDSNFRTLGKNIQYVLSLTNTGEFRWRFELKDKLYINPAFSGIQAFTGGLLVGYNYFDGSLRRSAYCLLNDRGNIITSFNNDRRQLHHPKIDDSAKTVSFYEGDSLKTFSCETGIFIDSKYFESKATRAKYKKK